MPKTAGAARPARTEGASAGPRPAAPPASVPSASVPSASVPRTARDRARAEITAEILDAGRRHLATDGAAGLSLRAVARELGMASSAVYRYVASRDDLLTRLIIDAYNSLGAAAEVREAAVDRGDLAGRWSAICAAVRGWALANPNEYALIYGSPVPGYVAPPDTIAPASRVSNLLVQILWRRVVRAIRAVPQCRRRGPRRTGRVLRRVRVALGRSDRPGGAWPGRAWPCHAGQVASAMVAQAQDARRLALLRRGFALEYVTLGWNAAGIIVLAFAAISAGSVALAGFGIDSLIEIGASAVVIWELSGTSADRQRLALRLIGAAFAALAVYLAIQSTWVLVAGLRPHHSPLGIAWTAITAVVMFTLAYGKSRTGWALDNPVLRTEGRVTLVDGILAIAVLAGLLLNATAGWWQADPAAGYVLVYYAVRECREIFSGRN